MSRPDGLTRGEAAKRLLEDGPNEIRRARGPSPLRILARQFTGAMTWLLLFAILVSALLGEYLDASAIAVIVVLNAIVGFVQEFRAERAVQALDKLTAPHARVIREARTLDIAAREVVRGDVLVLEAGDLVAADARLVEAHALEVNEASLTGESIPVGKDLTPSGPDTPLAERRDSVFMGTAISRGTALAQVEAVGMATELGRIAVLLERTEIEPTPLQLRLDKVGHMLMGLALTVVALVAILGLVRGVSWTEVLLSSISLAVAAVPEGLAVFVTVALAIGVQRMAARNVLVRRLPAVETLGCATTICTDKTGTLTIGSMVVRRLWGPDDQALLDAAAACCDAELGDDERTGTGDPTEIAILVAAAERGIRRSTIENQRPRVRVEPFDSETKRMIVVRGDGQTYVKGAPEAVFELCTEVEAEAREATRELAAQGLRVLAVASGPDEGGLSLRGLIGLADPPRPSAIAAIADARRAGIRTVMITGDHPVTARAIAEEMGILRPGESAEELVHARATPEDKIRIVREAKARGEVVAMTGDGVNDAPALREAHIGIAMGKTGTEVARQASAMILTDDDFASIIAAIREGRGIFDNIRKTLVYLLSGNIAELALVFGAAMAMLPMPLLPLQILWINLVTDGFPALALTMDPTADDVLDSPPRPAHEPILGRRQWLAIAVVGLIEAGLVLSVYAWALRARDLEHARSMAFSVLVFSEVFRALGARSPTRMLWQLGPLGNPRLLVVILLSITIQIAIHHIPFTQRLFDIGEISVSDCILGVGLGLIPLAFSELYKLWARRSVERG
jgi:Ca2+-transporting ATPase